MGTTKPLYSLGFAHLSRFLSGSGPTAFNILAADPDLSAALPPRPPEFLLRTAKPRRLPDAQSIGRVLRSILRLKHQQMPRLHKPRSGFMFRLCQPKVSLLAPPAANSGKRFKLALLPSLLARMVSSAPQQVIRHRVYLQVIRHGVYLQDIRITVWGRVPWTKLRARRNNSVQPSAEGGKRLA